MSDGVRVTPEENELRKLRDEVQILRQLVESDQVTIAKLRNDNKDLRALLQHARYVGTSGGRSRVQVNGVILEVDVFDLSVGAREGADRIRRLHEWTDRCSHLLSKRDPTDG